MTNDKNPKAKSEYTFMKQVIKKPPRKTRENLKKIAGILTSGIAIGLIATFTFAWVLPYVQKEEPDSKIEFPEDKPQGNTMGEFLDGNNSNISPDKLTLEGFRQVYGEIVGVAEQCEKALVVVQGITSEVDWMNNSYENKTQIAGILVAENMVNYYVLTEYRVAKDVERIVVTFYDGSIAKAEFVKHDPGTGLAVLKIAKRNLEEAIQNRIRIATLGSSWQVKRGEAVIAVGSPTGYSGSLAYGMVTSTNNVKAAIDAQYHLLTTDILGDSEGSGVLISLNGEVIGVMVQSFFVQNNQNALTAIPISEVKKVIEKLINNEDLVYLGIVGQDITDTIFENTGVPKGIYVNSVEQNSPAMQAGIQNGDVIIGIEDTNIRTLQELKAALDFYKKGSKISVNVLRRSVADHYVQIVFDVTLGAL